MDTQPEPRRLMGSTGNGEPFVFGKECDDWLSDMA
jgi:hypothetical protein